MNLKQIRMFAAIVGACAFAVMGALVVAFDSAPSASASSSHHAGVPATVKGIALTMGQTTTSEVPRTAPAVAKAVPPVKAGH